MTTTLRRALAALALTLAGAAEAALPAPCTSTSGATCDLWALPGSLALPGATATIWGFAASAAGPATVPGPTIVVTQGDTVMVAFTNGLAEPAALLFQGQAMPPDLAGVAPGASRTYTFVAGAPGTFLYEAGPLDGAEHQVAMGLAGALVVRPLGAPGQAYADPATAFDDEALVVLSEVDLALAASPATFDLRAWAPTYFLVGGQPWPAAATIPVLAGQRLLLRYVNAGLQHHSMALLGASQVVVGAGGHPRPAPQPLVAETVAPGQTLDAIVTVPATAADGTRLALYDAALKLHNGSGAGALAGFGGMLTFLQVGAAPQGGGADTTGPVASGVAAAPAVTDGATPVVVTAALSDAATGGAAVVAAEYSLDGAAAPGTGTPMTGGFGGPTATASATLDAAALAALATGPHLAYVRGQDALGNWGPPGSAAFTLDRTGPVTTPPALAPGRTNGTVDVAITTTASDVATGGATVVAAEWFVDAVGAPGTGATMALGAPAVEAALSATLPAAAVAALAPGPHAVSVRARDALGHWGDPAASTLTVDVAGPATTGVAASPATATGLAPVRLTATVSDAASGGSAVAAAEGFVDAAGAPGTGFPLLPADGTYDATAELVFADVPASTLAQLAQGAHTLWVRGRDVAGNWGAAASGAFQVSRFLLYFSTAGNANPPGVGGTADDADVYGWTGAAFARVVDATAIGVPAGANVDGLKVIDATHFYASFSGDTTLPGLGAVQDEDVVRYDAGTWSVFFDGTAHGLTTAALDIDAFDVVGGVLYFSTAGAANPPGVTGTPRAADVYRWDGTAFSRVVSAAAVGIPVGANVDGLAFTDATHFAVSFSADVTLPGLGAVQDEDVVRYDAGTWSVLFDGTARGLTSTALDVDAFSLP